jgi:hypothetical protein
MVMLAFAMMAVSRDRANSVLQKKRNTEPRQKQKHRHTVIDPRRATNLTASSTFAGSDQFCVNAIAFFSYNRVLRRAYCVVSAQDRSFLAAELFRVDRRLCGSAIQKEHIFERCLMRGDDRVDRLDALIRNLSRVRAPLLFLTHSIA